MLSEIPQDWRERLVCWTRWNKRKKTKFDGELAPNRNDEYLLYQTLVGSWPFELPGGAALTNYIDRIQQYMTKAVREAKVHSSWIAPNDAYERALRDFISAILSEQPASAFRTDFEPFAARIARLGMWNSLSQTLLKLTSPGVPDIYQGTELWDFSLVDPDNRRPVEYDIRRRYLDELDQRTANQETDRALTEELLSRACDGRIKLQVTSRVLRFRRDYPQLFTKGEYLPLEVHGDRSDHVCAFARRWQEQIAIIVAPRLVAGLLGSSDSPPIGSEIWGNTQFSVPDDFRSMSLRDVLTGQQVSWLDSRELSVAAVLQQFPVSILQLS